VAFAFTDDYRARLLALPALVRLGGGAPDGLAGALKGGRLEFLDHRPYVPGDDAKDLDWHGYLRLDQLVIKQYASDDAPEVLVILDRSASMGGSGGGKDRIARELAGGLAYMGLSGGCPVVVALLAEGGPVTLGTYRSPRKVDQLLSMLQGLGDPVGASWFLGLRHLRGAPPAGRVAFLISDFLADPLPAAALAVLARGGNGGALIHLVAEAERHVDLREPGTIVDPESLETLAVSGGPGLVEAYAVELARHEEAVAALARRHRLTTTLVSDGQPFERSLLRVLAAGARG
jgi:uncharacterized protein (DUF58 family)